MHLKLKWLIKLALLSFITVGIIDCHSTAAYFTPINITSETLKYTFTVVRTEIDVSADVSTGLIILDFTQLDGHMIVFHSATLVVGEQTFTFDEYKQEDSLILLPLDTDTLMVSEDTLISVSGRCFYAGVPTLFAGQSVLYATQLGKESESEPSDEGTEPEEVTEPEASTEPEAGE